MSYTVTAKWASGKPYKFSMKLNIPLLAEKIAALTPVGDHSHDQNVPYVYHKARNIGASGEAGGNLQWRVVQRKNWMVTDRGMRATLFLPGYAASVEQGATVPAARGHPFMAWNSPSDGPIIRERRKGYYIPAQHFIARAFNNWLSATGMGGAVTFHRIGSGISAILE